MAIQDIDLGTVIENGEDGDVARTAFTKVNENFDDLDARVTAIENLDIGTVTSVNDVLPVDGNVDLTPSDIGAATAAQGAKADTAVQADVFATALNQKVDKVDGYQLSQEDYTTGEKNKLAGLESSLFLGVYGSLAELEAAHPTSDRPGEYAFIPTGVAIYMFVWDNVTEMWVTLGSGSEAITAEQVKTLYESNPDTNTFTDAEKTKLGGIQAGAQVNVGTNISQGTRTDLSVSINSSTGTGGVLDAASATQAGVMSATDKVKLTGIATGATANQTDAYLLNRANHTGSQAIGTINNLQSSLDAKLVNPMTAMYDIIFGQTAGQPARLPVGSVGQTLGVRNDGSLGYINPQFMMLEYLVVAGGGSGGGVTSASNGGGGGGGGGVRNSSGLAQEGQSFSVIVGSGGVGVSGASGGNGNNGGDSSFNGTTSTGGGGGAGYPGSGGGRSGGSGGGGSSYVVTPGSGVAGQGNSGGSPVASVGQAGGGGGAGALGGNGSTGQSGSGGAGAISSITGSPIYYGGGGGGGGWNGSGGTITASGAGGAGGGGAGGGVANSTSAGVSGQNGTPNTGGGGGSQNGGAGASSGKSGDGASGVVIVRYRGAPRATGGTITESGGYSIHTFTASGTFTVS